MSKAAIADAFAEVVFLAEFEHGTAKEAFKYVFEGDGYKPGNFLVRKQDEESASEDIGVSVVFDEQPTDCD